MNQTDSKYIVYLGSDPCNSRSGKTIRCMLRFVPEKISGVLLPNKIITAVGEISSEFAHLKIPVYDLSDIDSLNRQHKVVIGIANVGGKLEEDDIIAIDALLAAGFTIINTLHTLVGNGHDNVIHYRGNDVVNTVATGEIHHQGKRILFVGTDYNIGKMTATVSMYNTMKEKGYDVDWIPTGQTGKLLKDGDGLVLDTMVIDFMPGNLEAYINQQRAEFLLIEGQGTVFHPCFSPTAFGLFHTSRPDYLILCDMPFEEYGRHNNKLPTHREAIDFYENLGKSLGIPCKVIGVVLNTYDADMESYLKVKADLEETLRLPCCDVVKDSTAEFLSRMPQI